MILPSHLSRWTSLQKPQIQRHNLRLSRELRAFGLVTPLPSRDFLPVLKMAIRLLKARAVAISVVGADSETFLAQRHFAMPPTPHNVPRESAFGAAVVQHREVVQHLRKAENAAESGAANDHFFAHYDFHEPTQTLDESATNADKGAADKDTGDKSAGASASVSNDSRQAAQFYAGAPLLNSEGEVLGVFSVVDARHRVLDTEEQAILVDLAALAASKMDAYRLLQQLQQTQARGHATEEMLLTAIRRNDQLQAAVYHTATGVVVSDPLQPDNPIIYANPSFYAMTGYAPDEILGRNCRFLQGVATNPEVVAEIRAAIREARSFRQTLVNYKKDGTPFWNDLIISPILDEKGQLINFVGIQNDVTERMEGEATVARARDELELRVQMRTADLGLANDTLAQTNYALKNANAQLQSEMRQNLRAQAEIERSRSQLRALAARLELVQEEERTRIAREIHDELGQLLTGIKMEVAWVQRRMLQMHYEKFPASGSATPDQENRVLETVEPVCSNSIWKRLHEMSDQIDLSIRSVRRIASDLRPGVLDRFGLCEALKWQAQEFQKQAGIRCRCRCEVDDERVGKARANAIFRIVQEALTNVARHASATSVEISLVENNQFWVLKIKDNGVGLKETNDSLTLGIVGMRERALLLGGDFHIESRSGKSRSGTTLHVTLPVERRQNVEQKGTIEN